MKQPRDLAKRYLRLAERDLKTLSVLVKAKGIDDAVIGFHAQQTVEKCLKALLVLNAVSFRKTHDLIELMDLIAERDLSVPPSAAKLEELNPYAVTLRYDFFESDPDTLSRKQLRQIAQDAFAWAVSCVAMGRRTAKKSSEPNVDAWVKRETPRERRALERASRHFDKNDALDVHSLEALYGKESSFGTLMGKRNSKYPAGYFQIDPGLAESLGLHVSGKNDERFDFDAASAAAAKQLKRLDNQFSRKARLEGPDYTIPIKDPGDRKKFDFAAYNAGAKRIADAQALAKADGLDPTKWENVQRYLEKAGSAKKQADITRDYVAKTAQYEAGFRKKSRADASEKYRRGKSIEPYPEGGHWVTIDHRHIFIEDKH